MQKHNRLCSFTIYKKETLKTRVSFFVFVAILFSCNCSAENLYDSFFISRI